jgi:adenine/guanine phosphoribosyltransferase-like PRPP-binding protein
MGHLEEVTWEQVSAWLLELSRAFVWDGIVGISRGGAILASSLSYMCPEIPLHFVYKNQIAPPREPFYVFESGRSQRIHETQESLRLTSGFNSRRPLVVDDVATYGDTLSVADELIRNAGAEEVAFALYAVDRKVLERSRPEIVDRIAYERDIDNSNVWLKFPWHAPVSGQ